MTRHRKERASRYGAFRQTDVSAWHVQSNAAQTRAQPVAEEPADAGPSDAGQPGSAAVPGIDAVGTDAISTDAIGTDAIGTDAISTEPQTPVAADRPGPAGQHAGSGVSRDAARWDRPSHRAPRPKFGQSRQRDGARKPRRLAGTVRSPADAEQAKRHDVIRGAAHGLLVTPWFAAGTGFLLAAGLWIYSPHASLKFSTPVLKSPCALGCGSHQTNGKGGALAAKLPGKEIHSGQGAGGGAAKTGDNSHQSASSGVKLKFAVPWQQHDKFVATITITGEQSLGSWRLSFTMPGTQITYVWGASWQPSPRQDGGTASPVQGSSSGSPGQPAGSYSSQANIEAQNSRNPNQVTIWIAGTGRPRTPKDCSYDGTACAFS